MRGKVAKRLRKISKHMERFYGEEVTSGSMRFRGVKDPVLPWWKIYHLLKQQHKAGIRVGGF